MGTTSFSSFKSQSGGSNFDKLREELAKTAQGGKFQQDDRFWAPERGKDGNDYAVIRFLPAGPKFEFPYVKYLSYGFKMAGGWYIENSRGTLDEADPVDELRSKLYATGNEADKELAKKFPRKTNFVSNIEIVDYPKKPELNGKRFLYRYGKGIFDKINDKMNPKFPDEPRANPFDFWEGCDFVLKVTTKDDFPNYDKSEFKKEKAAHRGGDDAVLEQIWNELYDLGEFSRPTFFKPYADLKKRLARVLGGSYGDDKPEEPKQEPAAEKNTAAQKFGRTEVEKIPDQAPAAKVQEEKPQEDTPPWKADDSKDELDFFKRAAQKS